MADQPPDLADALSVAADDPATFDEIGKGIMAELAARISDPERAAKISDTVLAKITSEYVKLKGLSPETAQAHVPVGESIMAAGLPVARKVVLLQGEIGRLDAEKQQLVEMVEMLRKQRK